MAPATTVSVYPIPSQRRAFRQWAGPRGVATLTAHGFAVPAELLADVPLELLLGARVNGEVYLPQAGQVHHDAPPIDEPDLDVVAGFPPPRQRHYSDDSP